MIKSLNRVGICPRVSLIGIRFVSFCGGCEGILFNMELRVRLCDLKKGEDEGSWVFWWVWYSGGGMWDRCAGRGLRWWICAQWIQAVSPFSFCIWLITSFVLMTLKSPIQGRFDDWAWLIAVDEVKPYCRLVLDPCRWNGLG